METKVNGAKFAFFYLLSLVGLIFTSISVGMVIFQIINKFINDPASSFSGSFSNEAIKFAISAIVVATPIFYIVTKFIYKSLSKGELSKDSGVRRWLTYFILFVSSVVMIGWLIGIINSFLGGEMAVKFFLKALTSILIAGSVFSFYLYDIRRSDVDQKKDPVIRIFFFSSLAIVLIVFVSAILVMESPSETRNKRLDQQIIISFYDIDNCVNEYYRDNGVLPENLEEAADNCAYLLKNNLADAETGKKFEYNIKGDKRYELCAEFRTSNKDESRNENYYPAVDRKTDLHGSGWQCLEREIYPLDIVDKGLMPVIR